MLPAKEGLMHFAKTRIAATALAASISSVAFAQGEPAAPAPDPQQTPAPQQPVTGVVVASERGLHRNFGFGTAFGGGILSASAFGPTGASVGSLDILPAIYLPTFEAQFFIDHRYSIDWTVPVVNVAIASAIIGAFAFQTDVFFNFNIGKGNARMILGPGLGFSLVAGDGGAVGSIRIPAEIGIEAITNNEVFGFKVMARPWLEIVPISEVSVVGGGAVLELGFSGYLTD
jgi:hypothetical protein